jgi:GrpB-like predicted nucleotidyltransferase (UPF0157 family)
MLGVKHGHNTLVDYDPEWPSLFQVEKARLDAALKGIARGIEHFGSTAVPGLPAKPILDILVGVQPLADWTRCKASLERLGYYYAQHAGVPSHFIFGRGHDRGERSHLLHIVEFEGESWQWNLSFRDALRADAELRERYLAVKQAAAAAVPMGRSRYNERKQSFLEGARKSLGKAR